MVMIVTINILLFYSYFFISSFPISYFLISSFLISHFLISHSLFYNNPAWFGNRMIHKDFYERGRYVAHNRDVRYSPTHSEF